MSTRRSYYLFRPVRPRAVDEPLFTRADAPDRLLWLDATTGVTARGAAAFGGASQCFRRDGAVPIGTQSTLQAWVRLNSVAGTQAFLALNVGAEVNTLVHLNLTAGGQFALTVRSSSGSTSTLQSAGPAPVVNTWYHLVGVRDGGGGGTLYVNGVASSAGPVTQAALTPIDRLLVGASHRGSNAVDQFTNGRVDQPAVWDRALSASEVATLYAAGAGLPYGQLPEPLRAGLLAWYELDRNPTAGTSSTPGYDLTPVGSPTALDGTVEGPADDLDPARSWVDRIPGPAFVEESVASRPAFRAPGSIDFDGLDDRLSRPGPIVGNRPAFTLLARVRLDALPASNPAVLFTESDSAGSVANRLAVSASGNVVASYRPGGGALASATSTAALTPGAEAVVAVRRDGLALQVFVNGVPSGPSATIAAGTDLDGATVRVGGPVESAGFSHLDGRISDLFAVARALTDAQIAALSA